MDEQLVADALDVLGESGFETSIRTRPQADIEVTLTRGNVQRRMLLEVKRHLTLSSADALRYTVDGELLLASDYVNSKTADALRRRGISFLDAAGNIFLSTEDWLIDVRGRKPDGRPRQPKYTTDNLYSPRKAQVIFALITWPGLAGNSLRELARCAGVSLGLAQSTTASLAKVWQMDPIRDRDRLIDGWVSAFPYSLGNSLSLGAFNAEQVRHFLGPLEISGEAAIQAELYPSRAIVYVRELRNDLVLLNRWRSDEMPNVLVRRKFWTDPYRSDGEDEQQPRDAPPLLVYADLLASDDPRAHGAAEMLRGRL